MKVVKRYVHFINALYDKLSRIFKHYQELGGEYYSNEVVPEESDHTGSEQDDTSDCDDVF